MWHIYITLRSSRSRCARSTSRLEEPHCSCPRTTSGLATGPPHCTRAGSLPCALRFSALVKNRCSGATCPIHRWIASRVVRKHAACQHLVKGLLLIFPDLGRKSSAPRSSRTQIFGTLPLFRQPTAQLLSPRSSTRSLHPCRRRPSPRSSTLSPTVRFHPYTRGRR